MPTLGLTAVNSQQVEAVMLNLAANGVMGVEEEKQANVNYKDIHASQAVIQQHKKQKVMHVLYIVIFAVVRFLLEEQKKKELIGYGLYSLLQF